VLDDPAALPYVDEHTIEIAADRDEVWAALIATLDRTGGSTYARLVGGQGAASSGLRPRLPRPRHRQPRTCRDDPPPARSRTAPGGADGLVTLAA